MAFNRKDLFTRVLHHFNMIEILEELDIKITDWGKGSDLSIELQFKSGDKKWLPWPEAATLIVDMYENKFGILS